MSGVIGVLQRSWTPVEGVFVVLIVAIVAVMLLLTVDEVES